MSTAVSENEVWDQLVRSNAMGLGELVVEGDFISNGPSMIVRNVEVNPFTPPGVCPCGYPRSVLAQFWHASRLWRVCFCSCQEGDNHVEISSVPATPSLPYGSVVEGNSSFVRQKARFIPSSFHHAWENHPQIKAMEPMFGKNFEGLDEFIAAVDRVLSTNSNSLASRIGGVGTFIQSTHEPVCPHCRHQMQLLCQLGQDTDFHWADCGQLYAFFCPSHPKQVLAYVDTH